MARHQGVFESVECAMSTRVHQMVVAGAAFAVQSGSLCGRQVSPMLAAVGAGSPDYFLECSLHAGTVSRQVRQQLGGK
jgi:hypothetical protein